MLSWGMKKLKLKRKEYRPNISITIPNIDATIFGKNDIPSRIKNKPIIEIMITDIGITMVGKDDIFEKNKLKAIFEIIGTFGIE